MFELHADYIYPLICSLKCSTRYIAAFPCQTSVSNTEKPLQTFKSAAKARKELSGLALIIILTSQTFPSSNEM